MNVWYIDFEIITVIPNTPQQNVDFNNMLGSSQLINYGLSWLPQTPATQGPPGVCIPGHLDDIPVLSLPRRFYFVMKISNAGIIGIHVEGKLQVT